MSRIIDQVMNESSDGLVRIADIEARGGCRQSIRKYVDDSPTIYKSE